jgi:hypothetical protein
MKGGNECHGIKKKLARWHQIPSSSLLSISGFFFFFHTAQKLNKKNNKRSCNISPSTMSDEVVSSLD